MNTNNDQGARNLLLVDDHPIVREGIKRILEPIVEQWTVIEASNGVEALGLLRSRPIGLVIVDLSMPGMSGLELIGRIRADDPAVAVMVMSVHAEEQFAVRAFKAGASGYLTKDRAAEELVAAIRKLSAGGTFVTDSLAERMVHQLHDSRRSPRHARLSDREFAILQQIVAGQRLTKIADSLHLSIKTVSTHKSRILEKLQLRNMAELIRYGLQHGFDGREHGLAAPPPPLDGVGTPHRVAHDGRPRQPPHGEERRGVQAWWRSR